MWRRLWLIGLAVVLAIPPARFALTRDSLDVDRASAAWKAREAAIARAKVFLPNRPDPASFDFARSVADLSCHFVPTRARGTTPKFDCRRDHGKLVTVKYGRSRERHAEVAATRLLTALGFATDRVTMARRVRCYGCPAWPFELRVLAEQFMLSSVFERSIDDTRFREFERVSVEEKIGGVAVEVDDFEGWEWRELALVDDAAGGASHAELDALRLMAVFLAHWDAKASNQRLVCAGNDEGDTTAVCDSPLLVLQDLGATFGPSKVEYDAWDALPIWKDAAGCVIGMENLPYQDAMFPAVRVSEEGRALLASRLRRLSDAQIRALFEGARFPDPVTGGPAGDLTPWVRAFEKKVREIADRPPCPSSP